MIRIHHLGHSQSERIVWLCEELELPYELRHYTRDPVTRLSPPGLRALHPLGAAPVIEDGDLMLAESAAIVEYLIVRHGGGRLKPGPDDKDYAQFLYWFHFANGHLQPTMMRLLLAHRAPVPPAMLEAVRERLARALDHMAARLADVPFLGGEAFTAADIMNVFSLTTMRLFQPVDLTPYPNILAYLGRIGARPAYRRAMAKGDPDLVPLLS